MEWCNTWVLYVWILYPEKCFCNSRVWSGRQYPLFIFWLRSSVWMGCNPHICSPADGHWGSFQFGAVKNKPLSTSLSFSFSWVNTQGSLVVHVVSVCLTYERLWLVFSERVSVLRPHHFGEHARLHIVFHSLVCLSDFSQSGEHETTSYCSFNLHFPNN